MELCPLQAWSFKVFVLLQGHGVFVPHLISSVPVSLAFFGQFLVERLDHGAVKGEGDRLVVCPLGVL